MVVTNPYVFTPAAHTQLIPYLAALQASCISQDGYIATFLPPLSHEKLLAWWRDRIAEVNNGTRVILLLLDESAPGTRARGGELVGVVMLAMPETETGPFRAYVEDLLVATRFRRRGAAKMLLSAVEMEAVQKGKTLLLADAESATPAEEVFKKMNYSEVGSIPHYGQNPAGEIKGRTFFYKELASA